MERYLMVCITPKSGKYDKQKLKKCSYFLQEEKNQLIFFISIYTYFILREVGNISPMVLFPQEGKKLNDLYHFQKVKSTS